MRVVSFALREYPEVLALATIIDCCKSVGLTDIRWLVFSLPVNTDFDFLSLSDACRRNNMEVEVITVEKAISLEVPIFGFKTDMQSEYEKNIGHFFDIFEVAASRIYRRSPLKVWNDKEIVVVGNIKIRSPVEEFQQDIFSRLALLPYEVMIVPRHPLTKDEIPKVVIPKKLKLVNTMGDLESLHAMADVVIMGRIFCFGDLVSDDDHNPFEATINANALAGINTNIPQAYKWIYEDSGLIHQCESYDQIFNLLPEMLHDEKIVSKLERRMDHVLDNRYRLFEIIKQAISI